MPNGRVHDTATLIAAGAATPTMLVVWGPEHAIVTASSFVVSGLLFSPDLDLQHSRSATFWRNVRLGWLWWPYAQLIPHRSPLSHHPIFGPLGRILYFAVFLFAFVWLSLTLLSLFLPVATGSAIAALVSSLDSWIAANPQTSALALLGFIGGGAFHSLLDVADTRRKRILHFWRKHGIFSFHHLFSRKPRRTRRRRSPGLLPPPKRVYRAHHLHQPARNHHEPGIEYASDDDENQAFHHLLREGFHTRGASLGLMPDGSEPSLLPPPPPPESVVRRRNWNE